MKTNIFTILANFTPKGTVVTVKTTNGGVVTAKLLENYRPSYDVVLDRPHYPVIITATRIKSVEVFPCRQS